MPILVLGDKRYEFDVEEWDNAEGMAIEKATGLTWGEFLRQATTTTIAKTALVWMVRRRHGEDIAFHDVRFRMQDFDIDKDAAQIAADEELAARLVAEAEGNPPEGGGDAKPPPPARTSGGTRSRTPKPSTGSPRTSSSVATPPTTTG